MLLGRGPGPLHPTTSPEVVYFCTRCFLSGSTPSPGPLASFPCHKTTKQGVQRRAGLGQWVARSGHTLLRGSSIYLSLLVIPRPASPACANPVLPFLAAGSGLAELGLGLCASGSWFISSPRMLPPQMDAVCHSKAFALFPVPVLCPYSPKWILKRLNPAVLLPVPAPKAGRCCLNIPSMAHPPARLTHAEPLIPVVLLPHICLIQSLFGDDGWWP